MKKSFLFFCFVAVLLLCACTAQKPNAPVTPNEPEGEYVLHPDHRIYDGPGYDMGYVGVVGAVGYYKITEESTDLEGNLWGKLEDGRGWIDLTLNRSEENQNARFSAGYASESLLQSKNYHAYEELASEYAHEVAFYAYVPIKSFVLSSTELTDRGMEPVKVIYTLENFTPKKPLVAILPFPGDLTAYNIQVTDESGATHHYQISQSGRDGTIVLQPVTPFN